LIVAVPEEIEDLIRLAQRMEVLQSACEHSFRQIPSRIVPGTFSWKCEFCGQMRAGLVGIDLGSGTIRDRDSGSG
jgi:hypothetical protein